jgi:putative transposase
MPHTYAQDTLHIIFATKDRRQSIPKEFQSSLWSYIVGICKNHGILAHSIGGAADHIQLPQSLPLAKAVLPIKPNSSRWAHTQGRKFAWQEGYAAFSVSASLVPAVVRYIQNQAAHHQKMAFDAEFLALLKKTRHPVRPKIRPWLNGHVSHLRRSDFLPRKFPPLPRWANLFRDSRSTLPQAGSQGKMALRCDSS